eukprot:gene11369-15243_t
MEQSSPNRILPSIIRTNKIGVLQPDQSSNSNDSPQTIIKKLKEKSKSFSFATTDIEDSHFADDKDFDLDINNQLLADCLDWHGNCPLHHSFAGNELNISQIELIMIKFPFASRHQNQFKRIPLHYALDRIKCNPVGVKLLLESYPEGVCVEDIHGDTPYDLAIRWKHSKKIRRMLLEACPQGGLRDLMKLKYGIMSPIERYSSGDYSNEDVMFVREFKNYVNHNDIL